MKITCDACSEVLNVPEKLYGKKANCPICDKSMDVPNVGQDDGSISNIRRYKISDEKMSGSTRKKVNYDLIGENSARSKKISDRKKSKLRKAPTITMDQKDNRNMDLLPIILLVFVLLIAFFCYLFFKP